MRIIPVDLGHCSYRIVLGHQVFAEAETGRLLAAAASDRKCLIVTDTTVGPLYADQAQASLVRAGAAACSVVTFPAGEASKTLSTVATLYEAAVSAQLDRSDCVVALGGGVVGDVAGFSAATYMRGVSYLQFPTTLLALVDSSVGGKTGVDLAAGKNLVGAFHQPSLVVGDLTFLGSLPVREMRCGLAEVAKYAMIMDVDFYGELMANAQLLLAREPRVAERVIARCCRLKVKVVQADETEQGMRAILNYGHTFGHALEKVGGFSRLNHGEAVSAGMGMAVDLASAAGLSSVDLPSRQDDLFSRLGLPLTASMPDVNPDDVLAAMQADKKVQGGRLRLVLPREIGRVEVLDYTDTERMLKAIEGRLG